MPIILNNHRVYLREFHLDDGGPMYKAAQESMDQLRSWMTWCRSDYSVTDAQSFILQCAQAMARGEYHSFAVVDGQTEELLGSVGLNHIDRLHNFANVGYWVRTSVAGRGVATSAARLIAEYAFKKIGLNRLEFLIPVDNSASQRVAQKVGAKFEGILRNRLMISGKMHDAAIYAMVRTDLAPDLTVLDLDVAIQKAQTSELLKNGACTG